MIRGFGPIKEQNILLAEQRWSELERGYNDPTGRDPAVQIYSAGT